MKSQEETADTPVYHVTKPGYVLGYSYKCIVLLTLFQGMMGALWRTPLSLGASPGSLMNSQTPEPRGKD